MFGKQCNKPNSPHRSFGFRQRASVQPEFTTITAKRKKKCGIMQIIIKKKRLNKKSATSRTSKQRVGRCSWLSDTRIKGAGLMTPSIWALRKKKAFLKKRVSVHKSGYKTYFANSVLEKNERSQMTAWCSDPKKPKYFFFFFY